MPELAQDAKRWWLVIEDGERTHSIDITVSGRELLMNRTSESKKELLSARFDEAAHTLREWFLEHA